MRAASLHRLLAAGALLAAALWLAACQRTPPPPSNVTPEKAVATSLRLTAAGDFDGLMRNRLPPAVYAEWRSEWQNARAAAPQPSAAQQQFAEIMRKLTAPGAEAALMKQFKPQLAALRGGKGSMPIFASILKAAGSQMIEESPQLGPSQRALASQALAVLVGWAQTTDFSDARKAQKAIDLACATARRLHVQTLAQWRGLDYATAMQDYGILWNGLENLLRIYGLNAAKSLTDARVAPLAVAGDRATIKLDVNLAGHPLAAEWPMEKVQGHWYDAALLDAWQAARPAAAATAAPGATSGLPATAHTAASAPSAASSAPSGQP